jgi:catalase
MNKVFRVHPSFRANHAKSIVVEGFKASPNAAGLSRAVLFNGSPIPATVRFSDATGIPNVPDGADIANPHGMAIKFHLPDGSDTYMVINSLKFFPVATGEDFRDLLLGPRPRARPMLLNRRNSSSSWPATLLCEQLSPPRGHQIVLPMKSTSASMHSCSSTRR